MRLPPPRLPGHRRPMGQSRAPGERRRPCLSTSTNPCCQSPNGETARLRPPTPWGTEGARPRFGHHVSCAQNSRGTSEPGRGKVRPRLRTSCRAGVRALVPRTCRVQARWGCGPGPGRDPRGSGRGFFQVTGEHTGEDGGEARACGLRTAGGCTGVRLGLLPAPRSPETWPLPTFAPHREGQDARRSVAPSPDRLCLWARAPALSVAAPAPLCVLTHLGNC